MLRGLHAAASGMYAQQRKTDLLTNNLANINTAGFKADQSAMRSFPEMLLQRFETDTNVVGKVRTNRFVGGLNTGVYMQETIPRFAQGDLRQTDRTTDLALLDLAEGTVFFTVDDNGQMKYTRNGQLTIAADGMLTTNTGWPVLDENGNRIFLDSEQFTVNNDGTIEQNGVQVARLGIAVSGNPETLIKEGEGLYRTEDNNPLPNAGLDAVFSVNQGYIEASNVDATRAMTDLLTAYRAFEANQKVLQAYDRSLDKAVNEIGRL